VRAIIPCITATCLWLSSFYVTGGLLVADVVVALWFVFVAVVQLWVIARGDD